MGFKAEQFVKSVDENLFCSICHEVFADPVSCKDGHTFCKDCIHEWLKTNRKCPLDNGVLTKEQLVRLLTVKGIIDNLEVYCHPPTQEKPSEVKDFGLRCEWVGKLQNLTQHRKTCTFQEVQCSHVKCNQTMQRRELKHHEKICDFRKVKCEKCGMVLLQNAKEKHIRDDCLQALILCPNRCTDNLLVVKWIKRINLADHLSKVCPKALVDCPYKEQGCVVKVERQDVEKHVQENITAHMMLLAKECSLLRKQNTSLTDKCSLLARSNSELKEELKQNKEELHIQVISTCSYTWTVHDYPNLSKNHLRGSSIESPAFWLRGHKWRLSLYPNGFNTDATGFLSLFLENVEDDSQTSSHTISSNKSAIPFRLTVISQKSGTDDVSYHCKSVFTKKDYNWGWRKFMKASDALSPSYCTNGILIIQCTILSDKLQ